MGHEDDGLLHGEELAGDMVDGMKGLNELSILFFLLIFYLVEILADTVRHYN